MSWFFDRPFAPDDVDALADGLAAWLCSPEMRWLVESVPGSRDPTAAAGALRWPEGLGAELGQADLPGLIQVLDHLGEICDWAQPGTVWDYREAGERRLGEAPGRQPPVATAEVAERAAALGLRSEGGLRTSRRRSSSSAAAAWRPSTAPGRRRGRSAGCRARAGGW
ncbi:MAG TPA: hypothetical protein VEP91_08220 [Solirubrobacterales bacterium]|nr:hypothetical protein [Solirubrobacterales bacterium]